MRRRAWSKPTGSRASEGPRCSIAPMTEADLDTVQTVEASAYAHPWSRRNFRDSLLAGHPAMLLLGEALPGELPHPDRPDADWVRGTFTDTATRTRRLAQHLAADERAHRRDRWWLREAPG